MPKRNASEESFFSLLLSAAVLVYLLPTLLYITKGGQNIKLLFFINLLTGWTIIGWTILQGYAALFKPQGGNAETHKNLLEEYEVLTAQIYRK